MRTKKFLKRTIIKNNKCVCVVSINLEILPDNVCRQMGKTNAILCILDSIISTKIQKRVK